MKTIYSSSNEMDVLILKEMLEKQNIRTNILRRGASDYFNIVGGNLISDIELQVMPSDVERAKTLISTTKYLNEDISKTKDINQKKNSVDKKVLFARLMLLFMLIVIIFYIIIQVF